MKFLLEFAFVFVVLGLAESLRFAPPTKGPTRSSCKIFCYGKHYFPVCGSNGRTYNNLCEMMRARCKQKNIRLVKFGKCPVCQLKEPDRPRCIVAGCFRPNCPAFPKAVCISICGCDSVYYYRLRRVNCHPKPPTNPCRLKFCGTDGVCKVVNGKGVCIAKASVCSLRKDIGPCYARFRRFYYDSRTQTCALFFFGGCRGNGNNFETKQLCEATCKPQDPICPADKPIHNCLISPCDVAKTCSAYPDAKCVDNYCGGCNADFYVDNKKVNCNGPQVCRPPQKTHQCKVAPCDVTKCPAHPKARCENNYCGGCNADFYIGTDKIDCNNICSLPKVVGPCEAHMPRYFYNSKTRRCERFYYGGCKGNKNNFRTLQQCTLKCPRKVIKDVCSLPKVVGPCKAAHRRYFYNSKTRRCERFIFGGCSGNGNNFKSFSECRAKCPSKDLCANVQCKAGMKCKIVLGKPICQTVLANPCIAALCLVGNKCIVVNGEARCVPIKPVPTVHALCAAVSCLTGKICVVKEGKPLCGTPCSSNGDCKQQGSFCNQRLGVCECARFCPAIYSPVCDSNGKRYSNKCQLDIAACRKDTTVTVVRCPVIKDICSLPKVVGPCRAAYRRFFYNSKTRRCERFTYGGCLGNKNNFKSFTECRRKCPPKGTY